jgi:hypothetical protein
MSATNNQQRAFVASHFIVTFDDKGAVSYVKSVEGGGVKAEVLTYQSGHVRDLWRQMGRMKYEDISMQVGMAVSDQFASWISSFFNGTGTRIGGSIIEADYLYQMRSQRQFYQGLISEIGIPALDVSSKEAAYMTVKVVPEKVEYTTSDSGSVAVPPAPDKQNRWFASNFSFSLEGSIGGAARHVTKIDGFTIKQQILEYAAGNTNRETLRVPGRIEYPNITIYVPTSAAKPFADWAKDHIQTGKETVGAGKTGVISFWDSDHKKVIGHINLSGVQPVSYENEKSEASSSNLAQVKVQLQVEHMEFVYGS